MTPTTTDQTNIYCSDQRRSQQHRFDLSSVPMGNLIFDPTTWRFLAGPGSGGLQAMADNSTKLERTLSGDTDNPAFGDHVALGRTARNTPATVIHTDEAGLKEDDVIRTPPQPCGASGTARLAASTGAPPQAGGTPTSLGLYASHAGMAAQTITKSATIPATAKRIEF